MFFVTDNGNPYVTVIYVSDSRIARSINEKADKGGYNRVTHPEVSGGYTYPILEDIAGSDLFMILKFPLPTTRSEQGLCQGILRDSDTLYAYVDSSYVHVVQIANGVSHPNRLSASGWHVVYRDGAKTPKRIKTLNRSFRWWDRFDRPLNVYIVPDDGYSPLADQLTEMGYSPADIESLLDGAFIINSKLVDRCLDRISFVIPNETADPLNSIDWFRQQSYVRRAKDFKSFNARIFGPMQFSGDIDPADAVVLSGMIKGEAYKRCVMPRGLENVDIICAASAIKVEVSTSAQSWILLEPQTAKLAQGSVQVFSDFQTIINLQPLFEFSQVARWCDWWIEDTVARITSGEVFESWYDETASFFRKEVTTEADINSSLKWNLLAWVASGRRYTESPWLTSQVANLKANEFRPNDVAALRFPVPATMRVLVISNSMAGCFGYEEEVAPGDIRFFPDMEALVVSDSDWIEMRPSHGGHDLDDFFNAYYRTLIDGDDQRRVVVLTRSPNDMGEYSIFNYVEGDLYPYWKRHDGSVVEFPPIHADSPMWHKRLSEACCDIVYAGLPSSHAVHSANSSWQPYSREHVFAQIATSSSHAQSVGKNVNARALYAQALGPLIGHRQIQQCTQENAIDAGTQGGSEEDVQAVIDEADGIISLVLDDHRSKIDQWLWDTRFATFHGYGRVNSLLTDETLPTRLHGLRHRSPKALKLLVQKWSQANSRCDIRVHVLGARYLETGVKFVRRLRASMVTRQAGGSQGLDHVDWDGLMSPVVEAINSLELPDRHDFVLGLYSACMKTPTSAGMLTDQIVFVPQVFPYLLDAMRYYGMARYITTDSDGNIVTDLVDEWELTCVGCNSVFQTSDPLILQRYHINKGLCRDCRKGS